MRPSQTFRRTDITFPSQNTASRPEDYNLIIKWVGYMQWRTEGGLGVQHPPPTEITKALQNRAKLNPIVKTVKNCCI